jgi:hypothetical protein
VLAAALPRPGGWRQGVLMMLDLWVAAGLLRLSADASWPRLGAIASIVVIRHVVARTLLHPLRP